MNKKIISMILALAMVFTLLPGLGVSAFAAETGDTYTFDTYLSEVPANWSPMSWATESDEFVRFYTQTPLVEATIKNSATGEYQWAFLAASSITDVTAQVRDDVSYDYVYEIALNPELCWEDGTPINADTYIYSMQQLLDPEMRYARAADFIDGAAALAGAEGYYFAGSVTFRDNGDTGAVKSEADLVLGDDGNYYTADGSALYIALTTSLSYLGNSLKTYVDAYGGTYFDMEAYGQLEAQMDENGNVALNDTTLALLQQTISTPNWGDSPAYFIYYLVYSFTYPEASWNTVGLTKVDDYTIRYTCAAPCEYFYFLSALSGSNWLIHEDLYESCKAAGTYGTSPETTMSYGPYKLQSMDASGVVLVRNEKHFEYTADASGNLSSVTPFQVDGVRVPQWQMDTVTARVLTDEAAAQYFLAGDLDIWKMPSNIATAYTQSPALYQATGQNTYSLMLNTSVEALQNMDASYGTANAVVLSNHNFRKAFSLATNRHNLNLGGVARVGTLGLINDTYYYDAQNNPTSVYRKSEAAMDGICDVYDVAYGSGTPYATLEEAYASIDGYDLDQARKLMALACDELVADGLYTRGDPIVLTYAASSVSDRTNSILRSLEEILNAAAEGTGFGTISVEARVSGWNWASEMRDGKAAMVLGGWSGSVLDPFTIMNLYLDPNFAYTPLNMDVTTELLTLNLSGSVYTMTWQEWGKVINGDYVESVDMGFFYHNLEALAKLESAYLQLMYAIPVASDATNYLLSYQVDYHTDEYSAMYGFGGVRLMTFHYTDAEWADYVSSGNPDYSGGCGNTHSYEAAVTEPTCTEQGYTTYTCAVCGHSYTGNHVDALGHSYEDGACTACGEEDPDYVAVIASGWSGVNQWTLTADGVLTVYGSGKTKNYGYGGGQPWLKYADQITSVVIEEGVTEIGTGTFMNLTKLEAVTLPETGLKTIGEAAFYGCSSLKEIYIPDSIYTIWNYTFKGCTALESVRLSKQLIKIDQGAFENCISLDYIFIPTKVEIIGAWSFKGCTALVEADMQWADAAEIRPGAFKNCSALTKIILPANIQVLGDSCFYGIGATSFTVPETVTEVQAWCFARAKLTSITFEGYAPTIGEGAFNKITLTAHYPADNASWTSDIMQNYGGTVTWQEQ